MKTKLIVAVKALISIPIGVIGLTLALAATVLLFPGSLIDDVVRDAITGNTPAEELTELIAEAEEKAAERPAVGDDDSLVVIPETATVYNSLLREWRELSLNSKGTFEDVISSHAEKQHVREAGVPTIVGEWFIAAHENYKSGKLAMRVPWPTYTITFYADRTFEWSEDLKRLWGWPESKTMKYSTYWVSSTYKVIWKIDDEDYADLRVENVGPNEIKIRMIESARQRARPPLPSGWLSGRSSSGPRRSEFTLVRTATGE